MTERYPKSPRCTHCADAARSWPSSAVAALWLIAGTCGLTPAAAQEPDRAETYARLHAEIDRSVRHNAHLARMLAAQSTEIAALEAQLGQLEGTAAGLGPLLERMYRELAAFVETDVPFRRTERIERLDRVESLLAEEGGSVSEKFRRLLEMAQIELEYGRTLGTYSGVLDDGRAAHFVHVGHVALLYRTADGRESGYWDASSGRWAAVDDGRAIRDAIAMANDELAPDLLVLPTPAPTESRP